MTKNAKKKSRWLTHRSTSLQKIYSLGDFAEQNSKAKPERQTQQKRIKDRLPEAFPPDGRVPDHFTLEQIQTRLRPLFAKADLKVPSTDTIARALGRRKRS
jgi:hypothetical protein